MGTADISEVLRTALKSDNVALRRFHTKLLAGMVEDYPKEILEDLDALLIAVSDEDETVRKNIVKILTGLAEKNRDKISDALKLKLNSKDEKERIFTSETIVAISKTGPLIVFDSILISALEKEDSGEVRVNITKALRYYVSRRRSSDKHLIKPGLKLMQDPDVRVRRNAPMIIAYVRDFEILKALSDGINDGDKEVSENCITGLQTFMDNSRDKYGPLHPSEIEFKLLKPVIPALTKLAKGKINEDTWGSIQSASRILFLHANHKVPSFSPLARSPRAAKIDETDKHFLDRYILWAVTALIRIAEIEFKKISKLGWPSDQEFYEEKCFAFKALSYIAWDYPDECVKAGAGPIFVTGFGSDITRGLAMNVGLPGQPKDYDIPHHLSDNVLKRMIKNNPREIIELLTPTLKSKETCIPAFYRMHDAIERHPEAAKYLPVKELAAIVDEKKVGSEHWGIIDDLFIGAKQQGVELGSNIETTWNKARQGYIKWRDKK
ncbi:MAG: hypothetical protein ABIG20_05430 [archaeon]